MKRILIIDDEKKMRDVYKDFLSGEGYDVILADSAAGGTYEMIKAKTVDLVLLDINMPGIDGAQMRAIIDEYDPGMKVLVSSVYAVEEQKKSIARASDYFDKAQGTEVLLEKIKNIFR